MSTRPDRRLRLLGVAAIVVASIFTLVGVPVTSAQGMTLFVASVAGPLPVDDPWAPTWDQRPPTEVPLSGQAVTPPMLLLPNVPTVRVRALTDERRIAVLLEWQDPTMDDSVLAVDRFADAVAMQLALGTGTSICMGQQAGALNIWHWKADWAADLARWRDVQDIHPNMPLDASLPRLETPAPAPGAPTSGAPTSGVAESPGVPVPPGFDTGAEVGNPRSVVARPSSVEDLNAVGFGTLTPQPPDRQEVQGASAWRDGVWRVVMSRDLAVPDPNDAPLRRGSGTVAAFAVWDGARGDRDGQKSVSVWLTLAFETPQPGPLEAWPFLVLILLALLLAGAVLYIGTRQPAIGLGWPGGRPDGGG